MKITQIQLNILGDNPKFCKFFAKMDSKTPTQFTDDNPRRITRFKKCCRDGNFGKITKIKENLYLFSPLCTEEELKIDVGNYKELDSSTIEEIRRIQPNLNLNEFKNRFNLRIKQAEIAGIKRKAIISYLENCFRNIKATTKSVPNDKKQEPQSKNKWIRRMK